MRQYNKVKYIMWKNSRIEYEEIKWKKEKLNFPLWRSLGALEWFSWSPGTFWGYSGLHNSIMTGLSLLLIFRLDLRCIFWQIHLCLGSILCWSSWIWSFDRFSPFIQVTSAIVENSGFLFFFHLISSFSILEMSILYIWPSCIWSLLQLTYNLLVLFGTTNPLCTICPRILFVCLSCF